MASASDPHAAARAAAGDGAISVLVAERDPAVRRALSALVSSEPSLHLAGEADDWPTLTRLTGLVVPDVAVVDAALFRVAGVGAVRGLQARSPSTRIVALCGFADREDVRAMIAEGAVGYMVRRAGLDLLAGIVAAARAPSGSLASDDAMRVYPGVDRDPSGTEGAFEGLELTSATELQQVIDERQFHIAFQPIFDLADHSVYAVEALARFTPHPEVTPDVWFSRASALGLDVDLELAVLSMAIDAASPCRPDIRLGINLSSAAMTSTTLVARLEHAAKSRALMIEVSERELTTGIDLLLEATAFLRARGVLIAVDDAGVRGLDLDVYRRLAPDVIKIDATVVARITDDETHGATARSIVDLATAVGAWVVAEGLETRRQLDGVTALGVPYGQGHLLGRPGALPLDPGFRAT